MNEQIIILYLDDEPLNLMVFEENFGRKFKVITTESGFEGMKILQSNPEIKIVVSDMKMPTMNGLEFITHAKKEFPNLAYYILTGYDITDEIADALNNHLIIRCFQKPFNKKEIEDSIKEVIKQL